jgi:cation/acetate symporter
MAAPLLANLLGGGPFLGFVAVVAFATVLAASTGLILSGAFSFSHDIFAPIFGRGGPSEARGISVTQKAAVFLCLCSGLMGMALRGQNVASLVGLAFAVAASANAPALLLSIFWRRFTAAGAVWSILTGALLSTGMIVVGPTIWGELLGHRGSDGAPVGLIPLRNPAIVSMTAAFIVGGLASLATRNTSSEAVFREQTLGRYLGPGSE